MQGQDNDDPFILDPNETGCPYNANAMGYPDFEYPSLHDSHQTSYQTSSFGTPMATRYVHLWPF